MAKRRVSRDGSNVEDDIADQLDTPDEKKARRSAKKAEGEYESVYKMRGDSRIPVSKFEGSVWEGRLKCATKLTDDIRTAWQEAIKYFNNDQLSHRTESKGEYSGNRSGSDKLGDTFAETENLVFANVTTLVPITFAKNPEVTITTGSVANKPLSEVLQDLINVLCAKKVSPGVNIKPKMKRAIAITELTNNAWFKLSWTRKEDASAAALQEYNEVSQQLAEAKSTKEVEKLEQKLRALDEKVAFSTPGGLGLKLLAPFTIFRDPTAAEDDLSQDDWLVEIDYLPTDYINCVFGEKNEDGQIKSIYKPSHTMRLNSKESDEVSQLINNFDLIGERELDWHDLGFTTMEAYRKACYTEVAYVWDKVKRRVLMYATNDWTWPIWVWDDPLKLDRFYPYYKLSFYQNPLGGSTKGEVTYYLDQQDAINEINDEQRLVRRWAKRNVLFNKNKIKQEDVDAYLKGSDGTARGVDLGEGEEFDKTTIWSQPPPSFPFYELFQQQKQERLEAINRLSSMNDVLAGNQFKTNTTNKAIDNYNKSASIRTDDRIDTIEDFLGDVFWGMAQLLLMNMDETEVSDILDKNVQGVWTPITDPKELLKFQIRCVGGSTVKPTSQARKEEAVKVAQTLGQFANASPVVLIKVLEVLQDAFDNIEMTDEEWDQIVQSFIAQQQAQAAPPEQAGAQGEQPAGGGEGGSVPPEMEQAVQAAVARGVPPDVARRKIAEKVSAQQ